MKHATIALTNMSKVMYLAFRARLRDAHSFRASMELIYGGEGPVLSGGGRASWPVEKRDMLREKLCAAFQDLDLSAALWLTAGRRRETWDRWRKEEYEGKAC